MVNREADMRVQIAFRHISETARSSIQEQLEAEAQRRLDKHLSDWPDALVRLEGQVAKNPHRQLFRLDLRLKLGGDVLVNREEGHELQPLIKEAFHEMERSLRKHLDRQKHAHLWQRPERRRRLRRALKEAPAEREQERRQMYFELVEAHLDKLYHFVQRELAYLASAGESAAERLDAEELTDAVILRGYERLDTERLPEPVDHWLYALAVEVAAEEVAAERGTEERTEPLEEAPDDQAPQPGAPEEEELLEYHQPDAAPALEDLVPFPEGRVEPESATTWRDMQRTLQHSLAQLPSQWRQAVVLVGLEGLSSQDAAAVLDERPEAIQELLGYARAYLRAKLGERGFDPDELAADPVEALAPTEPTPAPQRLHKELQQLLQASESAA